MRAAVAEQGCPVSTLTDNGMVFTTRHSGGKGLLLVQDLHVRIVNQATGGLLRELTIDPRREEQPTGRPPGPTR